MGLTKNLSGRGPAVILQIKKMDKRNNRAILAGQSENNDRRQDHKKQPSHSYGLTAAIRGWQKRGILTLRKNLAAAITEPFQPTLHQIMRSGIACCQS
jgi:hypothetical protein